MVKPHIYVNDPSGNCSRINSWLNFYSNNTVISLDLSEYFFVHKWSDNSTCDYDYDKENFHNLTA